MLLNVFSEDLETLHPHNQKFINYYHALAVMEMPELPFYRRCFRGLPRTNRLFYNVQIVNINYSDIIPLQTLPLHLGPLKYILHAHDNWGRQVLDNISKHLATPTEASTPDRIIHLIHDEATGNNTSAEGQLPAPFRKYLADNNCQSVWQRQRNQINTLWINTHSRHTFWTAASISTICPIRFHLPWGLIIGDLVNLGGGLLHCGLARHGDSGMLFLAPPSGGKSTTLSTAPPGWQVLSDDAALVWRSNSGTWFASPLPAWGNMIRPDDGWEYSGLATYQSCRIKNLLLIEKASSISLERLVPSTVVPSVFRSLCEYPATITAEAIQKEAFFRSAARMCREIHAWRLSLPLHGNIWPLLVAEAA